MKVVILYSHEGYDINWESILNRHSDIISANNASWFTMK